MITFIFDEEQATEAMVYLLGMNDDRMNYMKAVKMLYLADRESMSNGHGSITTDSYKSLPRGPVPSNILDCIRWNSGEEWNEHIRTTGYLVEISKPIKCFEKLSKHCMDTLTRIYEKFKDYDPWKLVDYCHTLGEWEDPHGSSMPISIESIIENSVSEDKRAAILEELEECSLVQKTNYKLEKRIY